MSSHPTRNKILLILGLLALLVVATLLAPEEAVLGERMRWVYVHVSFTWAGTSLINLAGLLGVYLIVKPTAMRYSLWVVPMQSSGLALFSMGFVLSLVASYTSWGGILWMEPRVQSSIGIIAGGILLIMIIHSVVHPRIVGILAVALSLGLSITLSRTGRVFHPDDPIDESSSTVIRMTFYALTVVAIALGVVVAMLIKGPPAKVGDQR